MTLHEKLRVMLEEHYSQTGDIVHSININWYETLGLPPVVINVEFNAKSDGYIKGETK